MKRQNLKHKFKVVFPKLCLWSLLALFFAVAIALCIAYFCTKDTDNKGLGLSLGVFAGAAAVILMSAVTLAAYFGARKKGAHKKYSVEVWTVAGIFLVCVLIKFVAGLALYLKNIPEFANDSVQEGFMIIFSSFYEGVGKLAYEGITPLQHIWASIAYYGASLYAGLMYLIIISAKASYEGYSYMRMCFKGYTKNNIYVFTALIDETLELAKSVKSTYGKKATIVFAGSALQPFDRHDELCREAMANGFLYWSYSDKNRSIADILHLDNRNLNDYTKSYAVFAFEANDHIPEEENNMDAVFSDIERRIAQGDDGLRIEYYILTKRNINYQAYESKKKELIEFFKASDDNLKGLSDNQVKKEFSKRFVLEIWNEAKTVAERAVSDVLDAGLRQQLAENGARKVSVWSLGFGGTAEAIANTLFVQTANIDKNGYSRAYTVDVFDKLISGADNAAQASLDGIFRFSHPDYIFANSDDEIKAEYERRAVENVDKILNCNFDLPAMLEDYIQSKVDACDEEKEEAKRIENQLKADERYRDLIEAIFADIYKNQLESIVKDAVSDRLNGNSVKVYDKWIDDVLNKLQQLSKDKLNKKSIFDDEMWLKLVTDELAKLPADKALVKAIIGEYILTVAELNFPHPIFRFNAYDCLSRGFYERFAEVTDKPSERLDNVKFDTPDVIVIATGDDYQNVRIANTLLQYAVNHKNDGSRQYIVINIFNRQNNDLIGTFGGKWEENKLSVAIGSGSVDLIIVGNYEDTYNYKGLTDLKTAASWENYIYNKSNDHITHDSNTVNRFLFASGRGCDEKMFVDDIRAFAGNAKRMTLKSQSKDAGQELADSLADYYALDLWKKESNKSVVAFKKMYMAFYEVALRDTVEYAKRVFAVEHDRWTRLYISDGWVYRSKKNEDNKQHACLKDVRHIELTTLIYDFLNAIWAVSEIIDTDKKL